MNTKEVGNLTELQCMTRLYELGCIVSVPFGNANKYDLIVDIDNRLYKVQCKHSSEVRDPDGTVHSIRFKTTWQSHNLHSYVRHTYTKDEVDFFATFYNGNCYLVPIEECGQVKQLRIAPPKNNQEKNITYLHDYLAEKILNIHSVE